MKHIELEDKNFIRDMMEAEENFAIDTNFVATVVCHTKGKVIYEHKGNLYYMDFPFPEDYDIGTCTDVTTLSPVYELPKEEQYLIQYNYEMEKQIKKVFND